MDDERTNDPPHLLPTLVLCRYPLLALAGLLLVPWIVFLSDHPLLANILVTEDWRALALVVGLAFPPAWIAGLALNLILQNQKVRCCVEPPPRLLSALGSVERIQALASLAALSLTVVVACAWQGDPGARASGLVVGLVFALVSAALVFLVRRWVEHRRRDVTRPRGWLARAVSRLVAPLGPGFVVVDRLDDEVVRRLAPGHFPALLVLLLVVAVTLATGVLLDFEERNRPGAPTLLMVELLVAFGASALPALSFFMDRWRIPLLVPLIPLLAAISLVGDTDARFDLRPGELAPVDPELPLERALRTTAARETPLVVVCAAGGGIQAAGWTAAVLTGLERETEGAFSDGLCLVSGSSGGSVGLMHFLAAFEEGGLPPLSPAEHYWNDPIYTGATTSSLFATAWGIVHGDLPRAIFPPVARENRGWAQERAWAWNVRSGEEERPYAATFGDLAAATGEHHLPGVVFQSTVVEEGLPFLLSSVDLRPAEGVPRVVQMHELYPTHDLDVVTAARLSASFPYVSPTPRARAEDGAEVSTWHFADGGYYENYGVTGAVAWLRSVREELVDSRTGRARRSVVVILIDPFVTPASPSATTRRAQQGSTNGWFNELLNPVRAVLATRGPSQRTTSDTMLRQWLEDAAFAAVDGGEELFHVVRLRPETKLPDEQQSAPPNTLSWHLTTRDRERLWRIWKQTLLEARELRDSGRGPDPDGGTPGELARLLALFR